VTIRNLHSFPTRRSSDLDVLYAKINNAKLNESKESKYKLATNFSIVSPILDNYTYVLFTVYSNPESNYPVLIEVNNNGDEANKRSEEHTSELQSRFDLVC